ncbi:MAG: alkaline phosphatase family protein [Anaerolineales bacterium]|jgi:predicted AlkP superfamily phosphohydrolase/phosphomutase
MRTLILGFDAFDPRKFEHLLEQGGMPNLAKYAEAEHYARLQVSNPPQSEVSWTSIATGLNPGQHGLFDFVQRYPGSYSLYVSLLPTRQSLGGTQFARPYQARTIFEQTADRGYPATSMWWPATFPARPESPVQTIPGLGTPDIQGRLGVGSLFTSDPDQVPQAKKTPVQRLKNSSKGEYSQELVGPIRKTKDGGKAATIPFQIETIDDGSLKLKIGGRKIELQQGIWSPILELQFKIGLLFSVRVLTRAILTHASPYVQLYFLPLQLHPSKPLWRYGTPGSFIKNIWQNCGPFLTIGWPQDTNGLEEGLISDEQFLDLCDSIYRNRARALHYQLNRFEEGVLGIVFDSLDRIQHMFWKDRPEIVEDWYRELDNLVGEAEDQFSIHSTKEDRLLIVSDHGFAEFNHKVHLNRWLIEQGYLASRATTLEGEWKDVDWSNTQAYGIGLNGLYLNLAGREAQGKIEPQQREICLTDLQSRLLAWKGPDGNPIFGKIWRNEDAFTGALAEHGPDLVLGFSPGYRASPETGLGGWGQSVTVINQDRWGADHCINPHAVPGVLFASKDLRNYPNPSYADIPPLAIDAPPDTSGPTPPPRMSKEEDEIIQERLKSLGYF